MWVQLPPLGTKPLSKEPTKSKREAKNAAANVASAALVVVAVGGLVSAAVNKSETTALVSTAPLIAARVVQGQKED
jgi:hypothetical protein